MEGASVRVPVSPIRPDECSESIYEDNEPSYGSVTQARDQMYNLHRRPPPLVQVQTTPVPDHTGFCDTPALLGFRINMEKSILTPCQKIVFLRLRVDSLEMTLSLPIE